jgi:hypothetical protein
LDELFCTRRIRNVRLHGDAVRSARLQLAERLLRSHFVRPIGDRDARTFLRQSDGDAPPNPSASSRNQRHAIH